MNSVAAETTQSSTAIHFNLFANARSKVPAEQAATDWQGLCDRLESLAQSTGRPNADKRSLPAWTAAEMSEAYNTNANVTALTALPIDVDTADADLLELCELSGLSLFVYATPSDPNPDGTRRLRIVAELTRPIFPAEVEHARLALAEHLEIGPGQGVETAKAVSQVMFSGRLHGTPERETWSFAGDALDVDELMARPLAKPWKRAAKPGTVKALARVDHADPDERTAALLEQLAPHWEAPGEATGRRQVLRALGGYLARRGWPDEQIAAVARALPTARPEAARITLMLECARQARTDPDGSAGWSSLTEWSPDAAAVIESVAKDPREPDGFPGVWVPSFARMFERAAAARAIAANDAPTDPLRGAGTPAADNAPSGPLILRSKRGQVHTLLWEGDELGHRPLAEKNLRLRIKELGYHHSMVPLFAKGGKPHSTDRLVEDHGATYTHTAYAFANRVTTYDPTGEGRVVIGYPLAVMPGRFDTDADTWLRALAGAHYERLAVWIASCSQANINRLSACLILMGRADSGKSMLGHAIARMWGQAPPALSLITAQFNADLLRCPILVDEEAQLLGSKELSTKRFRDVIQSSARSVEFKGLERSELYGGLRAVVSCNGFSDLRFKDLGGPAVIEALRDRMLVLNATERAEACRGPLARLRLPNDHRVDLGRVAGHLAWLCETVALPAERFLGAGGDETEAAILSSLTEEHAELWETFRDWLEGDGVGSAWSAHVGQLCANPAALALALERTGKGWDLPRVRAALAPYVKLKDYQPRDGGARPRLCVLDGKRVAESLGLGAEPRVRLTAKLDASERPAQPRTAGRFGAAR